jgi:hypothetical protein
MLVVNNLAGFGVQPGTATVITRPDDPLPPTGDGVVVALLAPVFPGERLAMTGEAVSSAVYSEGTVIRIVNLSGADVHVRTDGLASTVGGAPRFLQVGGIDMVVISHASDLSINDADDALLVNNAGDVLSISSADGTLSIIGAGSGFVYLTPMALQ